jgi:preprotein translocase subunit SecB
MSATNGGPQPQAAMPQIGVLAQYVKDLSFENPNAPRSMTPSGQQPTINIQVNVDAAPISGTDIEVTLRLEGKAESQGMLLFSFELTFAGMFRIQNVPAESMQPIVLIECPRLLFPFAREIIATAVRNGGFPPCCWSRSISSLSTASAWRPRSPHRRRNRSIQTDIVEPDRALAKGRDKLAMRGALLGRDACDERHRTLAHDDGLAGQAPRRGRLRKNQLRLAGSDQLHINFGEEFGVQ